MYGILEVPLHPVLQAGPFKKDTFQNYTTFRQMTRLFTQSAQHFTLGHFEPNNSSLSDM